MNKRLTAISAAAGIGLGLLGLGGGAPADAAPPCSVCDLGEQSGGIIGGTGIIPVRTMHFLQDGVLDHVDSNTTMVYESVTRHTDEVCLTSTGGDSPAMTCPAR